MKKLLPIVLLAFILFVPKNSFAVTYVQGFDSPNFSGGQTNLPYDPGSGDVSFVQSGHYFAWITCIVDCEQNQVYFFDGSSSIRLTNHPPNVPGYTDLNTVIAINLIGISNGEVQWTENGVPQSWTIPNYAPKPMYFGEDVPFVVSSPGAIEPDGMNIVVNYVNEVNLTNNPIYGASNVIFYKQSGRSLFWINDNFIASFYNFDLDTVYWDYIDFSEYHGFDGNTFYFSFSPQYSGLGYIGYFTFDQPIISGQAPVANAGPDINASTNQLITLDGSQSVGGSRFVWRRIPDQTIVCPFPADPLFICQFRTLGRAQETIQLEIIDNNSNILATDRVNIFHTMPGVCGNSTVEGDEVCDGNSTSCVTVQNYSGTKQCNVQCSGFAACVSTQSCGDNVVNGNEVCDGNTQACTTGGYAGAKACNVQCNGFSVTCTTTQFCGDGAVNGSEQCDDHNTTSGDGCSATCTTEVVTPQYVWKEAETGMFVSPMQTATEVWASGGLYAYSPTANSGEFTVTVNIPQSGTYYLWGRIKAPTDLRNSFYIIVDGGTQSTWDTPILTAWGWAQMKNGANNISVFLTAGNHTVKVKTKEYRTFIDKILVTNNASYIPTGLGL